MMLITQAPNYVKLQELALDILLETFQNKDSVDLSHKIRLCSTLAGGLACIFKHTEDLTDEECVKKAISLLQDKFVEDAETQLEFKSNEGDIVSKIFEVQRKDGINTTSLVEFLLNHDLSAKRINQLYGITISNKYDEIRILKTGYKFHNLVEDRNLVQKCIIDSHTKLKEASRIPGSGVVSQPCKCSYTQKTKRYYVIKVPKEYEFEVKRVNNEKASNA